MKRILCTLGYLSLALSCSLFAAGNDVTAPKKAPSEAPVDGKSVPSSTPDPWEDDGEVASGCVGSGHLVARAEAM